MKSSIFIIFFLLLVNCSSVKDNFSQINNSFSKLIISKKSIDSRTTRRPVDNKKYISKEKDSQISSEENLVKRPEKPANAFQLSNIFKSKKSTEPKSVNQSEKYPPLSSVPELSKDYEKIISEKDQELKKMHYELNQMKREVKVLEDNHIKHQHPHTESRPIKNSEENHLHKDLNNNLIENKLEVKAQENTIKLEEPEKVEIPSQNKIQNTQNSNNSYQSNSPKILNDLDESGLYVKPKTKKNTRSNLLPNSRYN